MLHKSFDLIETKADGTTGEFTALVSTFGNVDKVGDRILPTAYDQTLEQWRKSGDPLPIILSHKWDDPMAHIGTADPNKVRPTPRGLEVTGQLDVTDNPVAAQVYKLMKRRSLKEFSIGYSVPPGGEKKAQDGANEISEINLVECGPCLKGIDPKTELQAVKAALDETPDEHLTEEELRRRAEKADRDLKTLPGVPAGIDVKAELARAQEALIALELFEPDEVTGLRDGLLKAVWSTAYVNDLPDSAFLHIESGGTKDTDGKTTPRSLRHFPYKDANGNVDLPHLRNALARIPQSSLPQGVKDMLTARAQRILDNSKSSPSGQEPTRARPDSDLRRRSMQAVLEHQSDGASLREPPQVKQEPAREPAGHADLTRQFQREMLALLTGETA